MIDDVRYAVRLPERLIVSAAVNVLDRQRAAIEAGSPGRE
jgi:hypothetical protein